MSRASGICWPRRSHLPNTRWTWLQTDARHSNGCGGGYDLLIADLKMPGIDGLRSSAKPTVQSQPSSDHHHRYSTEVGAIEAVNLGVSGYLTKPFRVPQVLAAAAKALGE